MARKRKKEESIPSNEIPFPNPHKKRIGPMPINGNPRLSHILKINHLDHLDSRLVSNIRVSYENEDPCKIYIRFIDGDKFIKVKDISLLEFSFFAGYIGFGDVDRFSSGIDAINEAPILLDPYFGRIVTLCLDFPGDVVSLVSETNNYQEDFGEWHDTILRNELVLKDSSGKTIVDPIYALFMRNFEDDDFDDY